MKVCLGDEVIIDVENHLSSDSTTIHWHGHHQKNSPYMDGVPFVTQCPIHPGMTFRYRFNVQNYGTHFWHSHSGTTTSTRNQTLIKNFRFSKIWWCFWFIYCPNTGRRRPTFQSLWLWFVKSRYNNFRLDCTRRYW